MNIRQFQLWIKRLGLWLWEGKLIYMLLLVIANAVLWGIFTYQSEFSIRLTGYLLQLVGMFFAIRGLLGIRAHFGQPSLIELFFAWVKRAPKWKGSIKIDGKTSNANFSTTKAKVEIWSTDDPSLQTDERIKI